MGIVSYNPALNFSSAVALGLVKGVMNSSVYGSATIGIIGGDVDVTTLGDVGEPLDAGETLEIVSDNVNDFETMRLFVLGANGVLVGFQNVTLNGTTPVIIPGLISRINSIQCVSSFGIVGTVTVQRAGGGTVFYEVLAENQVMAFAKFAIPENYAGIVNSIAMSILQNSFVSPTLTGKFKGKPFGQSQWMLFGGIGINGGASSIGLIDNPSPTALNGPMDVKLTANGDNVGLNVDARMSGRLYQLL